MPTTPVQTDSAPSDRDARAALLQAHKYEQAMDRFEAVLKASPNDAQAHEGEVKAATAWALTELRANHPDAAMNILARGLKQLPEDPELLADFGIEATALGQFPIADQALHAADKFRPNDPRTIYGLARLEIERQHMPEAEAYLHTYLKLRPDDASAYYALGHIYAMQQHEDAARTAFEQSVKLQPAQSEAYYQLGELDLQAHDDAHATENFEATLKHFPSHAGALTGMGQIALRAKEYAKAEQYLLAAEQADPHYPAPHYFRGLALAKLGRKAEADKELKQGDSRPHATPLAGSGAQTAAEASKPPQ